MKNRVLLILILVFLSFLATGQSDSSFSRPSYFVSIHAGGLLGKKGNGSSLSSALLSGVRYKHFALGAGIGYDVYNEWRTMPVFGSLGYDFARRAGNPFFVQVNAGYSRGWNPITDEDEFIYETNGGMYFHPLVGYRIRNGRMSAYVTVGYKFQRLSYEQTPRWWGSWIHKTTVQRDIERLSVQIGLGFY